MKRAVPLLLEWYRISKRELPWRGTDDPYRILVSEVMLQQTRVEAVKEYYLRFLERFPTAEALALASEEEALKAWEGLGYYNRARNLKKAAETIARDGFPRTPAGVRALAGVGDYTAGAICSIAFNLPCPAVDGNVLRVLARLLGDGRSIDAAETKRDFTGLLQEAYPKEAGEFCEALMELGELVCVPNGAPLCESCPLGSLCRARAENRAEELPRRNEKRARRVETLFVYVLKSKDRYALLKRSGQGLLANMYEFPLYETEQNFKGTLLKSKRAKHVFTHVEWHMTGFLIETEERDPAFLWADREEIRSRYALPSAFRAFLEWLN